MKTELQDCDPMPFGKYRGIIMQEVPASYLHWLWVNGKSNDLHCAVANYIRRKQSCLGDGVSGRHLVTFYNHEN